MKSLRIIFMGTPHFACPALQAIIKAGHDPICIYTQPPRPSGRGQKLVESPVNKYAVAHHLPVETPTTFREHRVIEKFLAKTADVVVVAAYGLLLPKEIVHNHKAPCINIHASLLPRWRGAAPIQRAIMEGDKTTGVTIMRMETGLDTGPILAKKELMIGSDDAGVLHGRLAALGSTMIVDSLRQLTEGQLPENPQTATGVTYAHRLSSADEPLDWLKPATQLSLQIRALSPKPGASFVKAGEKWKILAADVDDCSINGTPGEVLDNCLTISCGQGNLRPRIVQRPGKKPLPTRELLKGTPVPIGTILA
ncbi:MAG: methionyl-tRNA formyltransferase [Pseudomonadota bacterium]|nr:methionyl-tRNA formyltransferase [Pseudomonadota bacterium]